MVSCDLKIYENLHFQKGAMLTLREIGEFL